MQSNPRAGERRAEVSVPAQRKIFDAIASTSGRETEGTVSEVEEVLLAERAFIQLHENQVTVDRDLADGLARLLPSLSVRKRFRQQNDD
jgi:hypothetical protein